MPRKLPLVQRVPVRFLKDDLFTVALTLKPTQRAIIHGIDDEGYAIVQIFDDFTEEDLKKAEDLVEAIAIVERILSYAKVPFIRVFYGHMYKLMVAELTRLLQIGVRELIEYGIISERVAKYAGLI